MIIENYTFGRITVNRMEYSNDLIIFPDKVKSNWWRREGHLLNVEDIQEILDFKPEVLIIGTGMNGIMEVNDEVQTKLSEGGIEFYIERTPKAVELYNRICQEKKTVAALHLTC